MINVGITGGDTRAAGELIRILINHPDVILRSVAAPAHAGERLDRFHRGLTGDTDLCFSPRLDPAGLNCIFLLGEQWEAREFIKGVDAPATRAELPKDTDIDDGLRIIDLTGAFLNGEDQMVYGFPEHHRKEMVRGAMRASLPQALTIALEMALFPLAKNHLLSADIRAAAEVPASGSNIAPNGDLRGMVSPSEKETLKAATSQLSTRLDPIAPAEERLDEGAARREAEADLRRIDPCFNNSIQLSTAAKDGHTRGIKLTADIPTYATDEEVRRLIDEVYDDHSFAFTIDRRPELADISNTNKCLLFVEPLRDSGTLEGSIGGPAATPGVRITAVIDDLVKGSAGNAVHCMNLLFGLSERTGLALKNYGD